MEKRRFLSAANGDRARVWIDGCEVTNQVFAAVAPMLPGIEAAGAVAFNLVDAEGNCLIENGEIMKAWHWGTVKWEPLEA